MSDYLDPFDTDAVVAMVSASVLEELEDLRTFAWLVTEAYYASFINSVTTSADYHSLLNFAGAVSGYMSEGFGV